MVVVKEKGLVALGPTQKMNFIREESKHYKLIAGDSRNRLEEEDAYVAPRCNNNKAPFRLMYMYMY